MTDREDRRRADLDREMREVLSALNLFSHVQAMGYEPTGRGRSSDEPLGGSRPPGDIDHVVFAREYGPPFHEPTRRYPGARTNTRRAQVLENAKEELKQLRGKHARRQPAAESLAARNERMVREGEGWTVREVAIHFRCGENEVRRARKDAGREPDLGALLETEGELSVSERRRRAHELREQHNLPLSAIARKLGVDKATISRDLRRVA